MILAAFAVAASTPSFACVKAFTRVEKMICADEQLAHLDIAVALDYLQTPQKERAEHRKWLRSRNTCTTRSCLLDQYETRVIDTVMRRAAGVRHYSSRPNDGDLDVLELGDGWYAFTVVGKWPTGNGSWNFAEQEGSFRLDANRIAVKDPAEEDCG